MAGDDAPLHHPGIVAVGDRESEAIVDLGNSIELGGVHAGIFRLDGDDLLALMLEGRIRDVDGTGCRIVATMSPDAARAVALMIVNTLEKHLRDTVCDRKKPLGRRAAQRLAIQQQRSGNDLHPYRCPYCGEWHVGHPPTMSTLTELAAVLRQRHQ